MKIAASGEPGAERRPPLNRERVLEAAVRLADRDGIGSISMRRLGQELGIEAMSLYTHVRGKDDLLDGMVDVVVGEIPMGGDGRDWKASLRRVVLAARDVVLRHPWAPPIIETRVTPGPVTLRYLDGVLGILRGGGLSVELTHHALHVMGSRLLGFTQDLYDDSGDPDPAATTALVDQLAATHPHVAELVQAVSLDGGQGTCNNDAEFEFALDLILDGLEQRRGRSLKASKNDER